MLLRCFFTIREPPFDAATNCLHSWRKETLRRLMHCNKRLRNCKPLASASCALSGWEIGVQLEITSLVSQDLLYCVKSSFTAAQQLSGSPDPIGFQIHKYSAGLRSRVVTQTPAFRGPATPTPAVKVKPTPTLNKNSYTKLLNISRLRLWLLKI